MIVLLGIFVFIMCIEFARVIFIAVTNTFTRKQTAKDEKQKPEYTDRK